MDEQKKNPETEVSPEEQLDNLLAAFLAEPDGEDAAAQTSESEEMIAVPLVPTTPEGLPEEMPALDVSDDPAEPISEEIPQAMPEIEQDSLWDMPLLEDPAPVAPILADEQAVDSVGLTRPEDLEFESILEETLSEQWDADDADAEHHVSTPAEGSDDPLMDAALAQIFAEAEAQAEAAISPDAAEPSTDPVEETQAPAVEEAPASAQEEPEAEDLPPRKIRPKNKNTYGFFGIPHMLSTVVWLALILFIGAGLGTMVWNMAADVLALGREDKEVTITILESDDLDSVAEKLHKTGLVEYPGLFKFYGQLTDAMDDIRIGTFKLNTRYDYHALVDQMSGNLSRVTTNVVIPEGYTCKQIFQLLENQGVCSAEKLEQAAANADLGEYWFLEGVERGTPYCLEGYLFPDTYQFYLGHEPEAVLQKMLSNFNRRFTTAMREKLDVLNANLSDMMRGHGLDEEYIASHQMTIREVVIIASMIEKETANNSESFLISSVIYNRLTNPGVYPFLNIDAALVYYVGHSPLTDEDKKVDSPYNTYLYQGLIPGPISNPGLASLGAALDPENTEYHFYALDPKVGAHYFSKTYQEHLNFLASLNKKED